MGAAACWRCGTTRRTWRRAFRERPEVLLKGVLVRQRGAPVFLVKRHEILGEAEESRHILGLVPVYPSTADLSVRTIRTLLHEAAPLAVNLLDPLPAGDAGPAAVRRPRGGRPGQPFPRRPCGGRQGPGAPGLRGVAPLAAGRAAAAPGQGRAGAGYGARPTGRSLGGLSRADCHTPPPARNFG